MASSFKKFVENSIAIMIVLGVVIINAIFLIWGTMSEDGSITLDAKPAKIEQYTEDFIKDANERLRAMMNDEAHTDEETVGINDNEEVGLGFATDIDSIISRRLSDGDRDGGKGWQCSKYTAYLATGKREYSTAHPDYGPVNGKDIAAYLVKNYGFKYVSTPVKGAIGSGGFDTRYGHTAMYLYSTGANTAMVNDANYTPLTVATHNMNISGWVWVVPGDYTPKQKQTPSTPSQGVVDNKPVPVADCKQWRVKKGDTLGLIMKTCEGYVKYGKAMDEYAKTWYSTIVKPNQSVYKGWTSGSGVGLYAGDIIKQY